MEIRCQYCNIEIWRRLKIENQKFEIENQTYSHTGQMTVEGKKFSKITCIKNLLKFHLVQKLF